MTDVVKLTLLSFIAILLFGTVYGQRMIVENQKIQMKQQFHSDFISLVSLFGEDGLNKLYSVKTSKELSEKEVFATGLMLQRFIVANRMRNAWIPEEWEYIEKDIKAAMKNSQLLRDRWEQVRNWYSPEVRSFLDKIVFDVLSEKEKLQILRDRFTNESSK